MHEPEIIGVVASDLSIQNLDIAISTIPMFLGLEVAVYNI